MNDGYIEVTGGNVYYKIYGGNMGGTPLLLIHGGPGYHGTLAALKQLSKNRKIIVYHQLGCGKSDKPKNRKLWTVNRFVNEVGKVRKALNLSTIHILGHSWGAVIASEYVSKQNKGVISLILASPFLSADLWKKDAKSLIRKLPIGLQDEISRATRNNSYKSKQYKAAEKEYYIKFLCRIKKTPLAKLSQKLGNKDIYEYMWGLSEFSCTGTLKAYNFVPSLSFIKVPTLITYGKYDMVTSKTIGVYKSQLKNVKVIKFSKSSHVPHLEEKVRYLQVINEFLNNPK